MVYICHINLEVVYVMLMPTYIQTNIQQESKEQKGVYIKQFILGLYWVYIEFILSSFYMENTKLDFVILLNGGLY